MGSCRSLPELSALSKKGSRRLLSSKTQRAIQNVKRPANRILRSIELQNFDKPNNPQHLIEKGPIGPSSFFKQKPLKVPRNIKQGTRKAARNIKQGTRKAAHNIKRGLQHKPAKAGLNIRPNNDPFS